MNVELPSNITELAEALFVMINIKAIQGVLQIPGVGRISHQDCTTIVKGIVNAALDNVVNGSIPSAPFAVVALCFLKELERFENSKGSAEQIVTL